MLVTVSHACFPGEETLITDYSRHHLLLPVPRPPLLSARGSHKASLDNNLLWQGQKTVELNLTLGSTITKYEGHHIIFSLLSTSSLWSDLSVWGNFLWFALVPTWGFQQVINQRKNYKGVYLKFCAATKFHNNSTKSFNYAAIPSLQQHLKAGDIVPHSNH